METTRVPRKDPGAWPRPFPAEIENPRDWRGRGPSIFRRRQEGDPPPPPPPRHTHTTLTEPVALPHWPPAAAATQIRVPHVFFIIVAEYYFGNVKDFNLKARVHRDR